MERRKTIRRRFEKIESIELDEEQQVKKDEESEHLETEDIIVSLKRTKTEREFIAKMKDKNKLKWKISVVKNRKLHIFWESFIVITAIWYWFIIPIRLSIRKDLFGVVYDYIDLITWLIYLFDIFVNFRTTYITSNGIEVTDTSDIAKNYLVSFRIIADMISILSLPSLFINGWPEDI